MCAISKHLAHDGVGVEEFLLFNIFKVKMMFHVLYAGVIITIACIVDSANNPVNLPDKKTTIPGISQGVQERVTQSGTEEVLNAPS